MNLRPPLLILSCLLLASLSPAAEELKFQPVPDFFQLPTGVKWGQATGVALDAQGNIFVAHRGEHPILLFDAGGKFLRSFGDGAIKVSHGLRLDAVGNVWASCLTNHTVCKFSPDGKLLLTLGVPGQSGDDERHFNRPTDIAFAPNGDLFVSDGYVNSRVVKFSPAGKFLLAWGRKGKGEGEFVIPHNLRLDSQGRVFVNDRENKRIQVFDQSGKFLHQFGGFASYGLFISATDRLFVADGLANKILIFTAEGEKLTEFGALGSELGKFNLPHGITGSLDGALFVAEINGKRVQKFVKQ